jgi:hypothetical protein
MKTSFLVCLLNWYNETKAKKEQLLTQILHFIKQILL